MKHIAVLTERLKIGFGVDLVVLEQCKRLTKNYDVTVFAQEIDQNLLKNAHPFKIKQLYMPNSFNPLKADLYAFKYLSATKHIFNLYDALIVHTPPTYVLPLLMRHKNILVCDYGNSPSFGYKFPVSLRKNILEFTQQNFYFPYAKRIITISDFLKRRFSSKLQKKTIVNYLGADHIRNTQVGSKDVEKFNSEHHFNENDIILLYIGRLDYKNNPYKNTNLLINKFIELRKKYSNLRLCMVGYAEGNIVADLKKLGIDVIKNASNQELRIALDRCSIYLSPSLWEGFNLPLIEAQSVGKPVIAFNLGAHREVVQKNKSGFLVETENEFTEATEKLIKSDNLRISMGKSATEWSKQFNWENNVKQLAYYIEHAKE